MKSVSCILAHVLDNNKGYLSYGIIWKVLPIVYYNYIDVYNIFVLFVMGSIALTPSFDKSG